MVSHPRSGQGAKGRAQQVALFRYQVISPALDPHLSNRQRGKIVNEVAQLVHSHPVSGPRQYSRVSLDRWIKDYRTGGFEALVPSVTKVAPRTDPQVLELAAGLKAENPDRTAAQVRRIMTSSMGWSPSESTLLRLFHARELMGPASGHTGEVFGRYEAGAANERWVGDALHGPKLLGRKMYLFAFLDDHTRLVTGYRFGFSEDLLRLSWAFQNALKARGVPHSLYVDNGSAYVDDSLLRACGKLGIRLIHSTPHRPQGKGKVERFFRTVREQFLVEFTDEALEQIGTDAGGDLTTALAEVNRLFSAWVETVYHRQVHSETKQSPVDRWGTSWARAGHPPPLPADEDLAEAFKWSEERTVSSSATVSMHRNKYEVSAALVGRKVELVFTPFDLEKIEVRYNDKSYGLAVPFVIHRHVHPKARPEVPTPPPARTKINYLSIVADDHQDELRNDNRINYHPLKTPHAEAPNLHEGNEVPGQMSIDDFAIDINDKRNVS